MNLANYKLLSEDDDMYHIQHSDGSSFKIAKQTLGPNTLAKMRLHFAKGGPVPDVTEGGEDRYSDPFSVGSLTNTPQATRGISDDLTDIKSTDSPWSKRVDLAHPEEARVRDFQAGDPVAGPSETPAAPEGAPTPELPGQVKLPSQESMLESAKPREAPVSGGPNTMKELGAAEKMANEGIQADAKARSEEARQQAAAQDAYNVEAKAARENMMKDYNDTQAKADKISEDIANAKIDPQRLWNSKSDGQKATAAIGMILGGIGAGITHGPNYAMDIIDKSIDRDIDAQKADLGKKQSQLQYYMQKGHNIQQAYELAKSDKLDALAGQFKSIAAHTADPKIQAEALKQSADLKQRSALGRQQAFATGYDIKLKGLQIKGAEQGMEYQKRQMEVMDKIMKGGDIDDRALEMLNPEVRKRVVTLADGSRTLAPDDASAGKFRDSQGPVLQFKDTLKRYTKLYQHGDPKTFDRGTAESIRNTLLEQADELKKSPRVSETTQKLLEKRIADISSLNPLEMAHNKEKLEELGNFITSKIAADERSFLNKR